MIIGFDKETQPLTDYEENTILPVVFGLLSGRVGVQNAIKNGLIVKKLSEYKITQERVRKVINQIRTRGLIPCLIASSKGYYIAETEEELKDYEESLEGRESAIRAVRESIRRQRIERYEYRDTLF